MRLRHATFLIEARHSGKCNQETFRQKMLKCLNDDDADPQSHDRSGLDR